MRIGMFLSIYEKDMRWFPQFTKQAEILGYPVSWFADHLSKESLKRIKDWKLTHFVHNNQTQQFDERSKGFALKGLNGFDWAIQMDSDETWQDGAKELIEKSLLENPDGYIANCPMVQVHTKDGKHYRRTDPYFTVGTESKRDRIYNLKHKWAWLDPFTNGAYRMVDGVPADSTPSFKCEAETAHWGYSTWDLCDEHKETWDRVYMNAGGRNPYNFYEGILIDRNLFGIEPLDIKFTKHL